MECVAGVFAPNHEEMLKVFFFDIIITLVEFYSQEESQSCL